MNRENNVIGWVFLGLDITAMGSIVASMRSAPSMDNLSDGDHDVPVVLDLRVIAGFVASLGIATAAIAAAAFSVALR